jgi:pilin isopeptide linkage protein
MAHYLVNDTDSLEAAFKATESTIDVEVTGDFTLTKRLLFPAVKTVTMKSTEGQNYTITKGGIDAYLYGGSNNMDEQEFLTISNLTFDGNGTNYIANWPFLDYEGNGLTIDSVTVKNCQARNTRGNVSTIAFAARTAVLKDFQVFDNVFISNSRSDSNMIKLSVNNLTITGNTKIYNNKNSCRSSYGIIYCLTFDDASGTITDGVVTIEGGEFYDNEVRNHGAGVLFVQSPSHMTVNITGGKIYNNKTRGIHFVAAAGGILHMSGGSIESNIAHQGGAMFLQNLNTLTVDGEALINANTSSAEGGGIYYDTPSNVPVSFTIDGHAQISGNTAKTDGGGMYIKSAGGGTITIGNNAATKLSAALRLADTLNYPTITGNTAGGDGGGIWVDPAKRDTLTVKNGAEFSGNKAATNSDIILDQDKALYAANILGKQWTTPHVQGYNNDDINYLGKKPATYTVGDGTDGGGNPDTNNKILKTIDGGAAVTDGQFQFGLYDDQGNQIATGKNDASGNVTFTPITYNEAKSHKYTVKELPSHDINYSEDPTVYPVTLNVINDGQADNKPLTVTITWDGGTTPTFVNKKRGAKIKLEAKKQITSNTPDAQNTTFHFNLMENGQVVSQAANDVNGNVVFPELSYDALGSHTYQIVEVVDNPPLPGWQYDQHSSTVIITVVTDPATGALMVATPAYPDASPVFVNTYTAKSLTFTPKIMKKGNAPLPAGAFHFIITDDPARGGTGQIIGSGTNDANGNVVIPITISQKTNSDIYYIAKEVPPAPDGWRLDTPPQEFAVAVNDINGQLTLQGDVQYQHGDHIEFYNTYRAEPAKLAITATKIIQGWTLPDKPTAPFTFVLKDENGDVVKRVQSADGTVDFGEIDVTSVGNRNYTISEEGSDGNGWTLDKTAYPITVSVTDDGKGHLTGSVNTVPTLTNTYKAAPVTIPDADIPKATKVISGGPALEAGQFTFGVFDKSDHLITTGTNDAAGNIIFPTYTYDTAGTYDYTIKETTPDGGGYTTDKNTYPYKVEVTDDGLGHLTLQVTQNNPVPTFTNTYTTAGSEHLLAYKSLQGWDSGATPPTFTFRLVDSSQNVVKEIDSSSGTLDFGVLSYTQPGSYEYTVEEVTNPPLPAGWSVQKDSFKVVVHATDDTHGNLIMTVDYPDSGGTAPQFVNTYTSLPANVGGTITNNPSGENPTKTATGGHTPLQDSQFKFGLYDGNGNLVALGFNEADGKITFPLFYRSNLGETDYTMKEVTPDGKGWTTDKTVYPVKVVISDDGQGHRIATVTYPNGTPAFKNTYKPGDAPTNILNKVVGVGKTPGDGEFEFTVTDDDGNELGKAHNDGNGNIIFPPINLPEGKHHLHVVAPPDGNGWHFPVPDLPAEVEVTDNGDGTSTSHVTYPNGDTFYPIYTPTPADITEGLNGDSTAAKKSALDGDPLTDRQFAFGLYDENDNLVGVGFNDAAGKITFSPVFTTKVGDFTYHVKEMTTDGGGWTTDKNSYPLNVHVTDNSIGQIISSVSWPGGVPTFVNEYNSPASEHITALKAVHGYDGANKQFDFILKDASGNLINTAQNASGVIDFGDIDYTHEGTYEYTIEEKPETVSHGWSTDPIIYPVVVTVKKDGQGHLVTSVSYPGGNTPIFDNYYVAEDAHVKINATLKTIGKKATDGQFAFEIDDAQGRKLSNATNDGNGNISFPQLDLPPGDYDFVIKQTSQDGDGWTTDKKIVPVHIHVEDDGNGHNIATITYPGDDTVFTNVYRFNAANVTLTAHKEVDGARLSANCFSFGVFDENKNQVATASNEANGDVVFRDVTISAPGVYHYTIKELTTTGGGWLCDNRTFGVTITVTDDGRGNLMASVAYVGGAEPTFINSYSGAEPYHPCYVTVCAKKSVTGACLCNNMFRFGLFSEDGREIARATNDAFGNIKFPPLVFSAPGVYHYTMREYTASGDGWQYDKKTIGVTITSRDTGSGRLLATVSYDRDATFVNRYLSC